jgi:hypothetical protein
LLGKWICAGKEAGLANRNIDLHKARFAWDQRTQILRGGRLCAKNGNSQDDDEMAYITPIHSIPSSLANKSGP